MANGTYSVFKITNNKPGKKKKSYYFVTGVYDDPDKVKTRIRGIASSNAVRGGAKSVASDMARDKNYEDHFSVKKVASGLSKKSAGELRNRLKEKTPQKKSYNEPR